MNDQMHGNKVDNPFESINDKNRLIVYVRSNKNRLADYFYKIDR